MHARRVSPAWTGPRHAISPDPDIPPDHRGRQRCTTCRLMGLTGDSRHLSDEPEPAKPLRRLPPDVAEQYRAWDAAILGEKD